MSIFDLANQSQSPSMGGTGGIGALSGGSVYPLSRMDKTQYATPLQLPTSAEVISSDYDPKTDAFTGMPNRFAMGGIASIPRYDGEDGSQVETWNPESGHVKLQTLADPQDPYGAMKSVDYTIPKDQIKNYAPNIDQTTGMPTGGGAYVLKDGSTIGVDPTGIVSTATPGRGDYKLNEQGYYQPVGENLTWDSGLSQLTKKIGGVDVVVDPLFTKGGYQDPKGNLRVDENGVPIPLPPAQYDSGAGKSGLADAAPYIVAGTIGAGVGLSAMPGLMATEGAGALTTAELMAGAGGSFVPTAGTGASFTVPGALASTAPTVGGITALDAGTKAAISSAAAPTYTTAALPSGITSVAPVTSSTMLPGAAALQASGSSLGAAAAADVAAKTASMTPMQKYVAASMAAKALSSGGGGGGGPSSTTTTTQAPPTQNVASNQFNPAFTMPNMFAMNQAAPGMYYQPQTFSYNTRRAAQGGMMHAQGGVADLGGYAAGGKLLKGPGDGMSDDIVANIAGKQPARLADGEFVVPADVVSHLGNGSTDAGAKHLYKMMDRIRQARTGNPKQGKRINPDKFLPKG